MTLLNGREAALVARLLRGLNALYCHPLTPEEVESLRQRLEQGEQGPIGPGDWDKKGYSNSPPPPQDKRPAPSSPPPRLPGKDT